MPTQSETEQRLSSIDDSDFERLALRYLTNLHPELRGLAATGINEDGKPIPCPVDGLHYLPGSPPSCVFVASTTIKLRDLRRKWLGANGKPGDIAKAASVFSHWRQAQSDVVCSSPRIGALEKTCTGRRSRRANVSA